MKTIALLFLSSLMSLLSAQENGKEMEPQLQGAWQVTEAWEGNKKEPEAALKGMYLFFEKGAFSMREDSKWLKGTFKVDLTKKPAFIDIEIQADGERQRVSGIWKIEAKQLVLAVGREPVDARPENFELQERTMLLKLTSTELEIGLADQLVFSEKVEDRDAAARAVAELKAGGKNSIDQLVLLFGDQRKTYYHFFGAVGFIDQQGESRDPTIGDLATSLITEILIPPSPRSYEFALSDQIPDFRQWWAANRGKDLADLRKMIIEKQISVSKRPDFIAYWQTHLSEHE